MTVEKRTPVAPKARQDRLFVQDVGDELVIFDQDTRKAHRLNPTAALVWNACDGRATLTDIVQAIRPKLGPTVDENLVRVALGRLEAVRLLESASGQFTDETSESRRAFLRKGAAAGAVSLLMPVVATLPRPTLAAALSPVGPRGPLPNGYYQLIEPMPKRPAAMATFGGGCFWCLEPPFDMVAGVISTTAGYMGGTVKDPTYDQVIAGNTGHAEVVRVLYDPQKLSYARLLEIFWRNIDPTQVNGQFCDLGPQYRTAIFYHNEDQKSVAFASRSDVQKVKGFSGGVVTEIVPAGDFYKATEEHQDYYQKNPARYKSYVQNCGREARLKALWGPDTG